MKEPNKVVAIKVDGCAHHNLVITGEMLKEQGYFIPSDIRKVHVTFNTEKK
jgi:hypothetical protein